MKRLRNWSLLIAVLLVVFAISSNVKAEDIKRDTVSDDVLVSSLIDDLKPYGEGVYAGGAVYNLRQVDQTENSISLTWDPAAGATSYIIGVYDLENQYVGSSVVAVNSAMLNLSGRYKVIIVPGDENDYCLDKSKVAGLVVATTPTKITGVQYKSDTMFGGKYKLAVSWEDSNCTGFEAVCYNKKGKKVQTIDEYQVCNVTFNKTNTQNIYTVKVRGYSIINGTERIYGPYSATFYAVPQPQNASTKSDLKQNSINLKWKKVKGATKYDIYVSQSMYGGFKKVATVKGNASSYLITRYKGKTLNLLNTYHYVKVVTYAKFGKKTVKSGNKGYVGCRVTRYYY